MLNIKVFSICIFFLFLFVLLFLDKCTSRNISTMFNSSAFYKYPELTETPSSANYEIRKIIADTYVAVTYSAAHQFFIVSTRDSLLKLDAGGKELYHLENNQIDLQRYSHYAIDSSGVYDFSETNLNHQPIKRVLNLDQKMTPDEWQSHFEAFYKNAEVVIYAVNNFYQNSEPIYIKVKGEWIVLILQKYDERWDDADRISGIKFKGYPAKYSPMFLLKDQEKGEYADLERTSDSFLKTYYTIKIKESSLRYPMDRPAKMLSYKKDGVESYAAYISLPMSWSIKAGYELNVGREKICFKGDAVQDIGFSKPIETFLTQYRVPEAFAKQTDVGFLKYEFPSNGPQSLNNGLYLISKK